ncbi:MAG: M14 family zinc carboxypeptidase, partial [bacterium]|nr:M14 family zinc carboxypeptidase [bacterium]
MKKSFLLFTLVFLFFCSSYAEVLQYQLVDMTFLGEPSENAINQMEIISIYIDENGIKHFVGLSSSENSFDIPEAQSIEITPFSINTVEERAAVPTTDLKWSYGRYVGEYRYHERSEVYEMLETLQEKFPRIAKVYDLEIKQNGSYTTAITDGYNAADGNQVCYGNSFSCHPYTYECSGETCNRRNNRIKAIKISSNPSVNLKNKSEIVVSGLYHAREWITVEITFHLAQYLLYSYDINPAIKELVDNSEIWIVPIINPDGYEFTWERDRMWRKNTRIGAPSFPGEYLEEVVGVDLNRNFYEKDWGMNNSELINPCLSSIFEFDQPFETDDDEYCYISPYLMRNKLNCDWCIDDIATSPIPQMENYCGSKFSEVESRVIRDLLDNKRLIDNPQGFMSFHNYSQALLYHFGDGTFNVESYNFQRAFAERMINIVNNVETVIPPVVPYVAGRSCSDIMYPTTGDTNTWFMFKYGVKPAMIMEVRPLEGSFHVPPEQIESTVKENIASALYYIDYIRKVSSNNNWQFASFDATLIDIDPDEDGIISYLDNCPY